MCNRAPAPSAAFERAAQKHADAIRNAPTIGSAAGFVHRELSGHGCRTGLVDIAQELVRQQLRPASELPAFAEKMSRSACAGGHQCAAMRAVQRLDLTIPG